MAYPRKGSFTLAQAKTMLAVDPLFNSLSDAEKNIFVNNAAQLVCSFRNEQKKEDYAADTIDITAITSGMVGVDSYGPTADRPVFDSMTQIGYCYYDTDITAPVWWSGVEWSDQ